MEMNKIIIKANSLIEARYSYTLNEQRFILAYISLLNPKGTEEGTLVEMSIREFVILMGIDIDRTHNFYERIRELIKELVKKVVSIKTENGFMVVGWFSSIEYDQTNKIVKIRSSAEIKPYLLELRGYFTQYKLFNVIRLASGYSIRIYELLKQYEKIGNRKINIEELREILGISKEIFTRYFDFKRFVIIKSQKDLLEKTDIKFDFKELKCGRRVVALEFIIYPNDEYDKQVTLEEFIEDKEENNKEVEETLSSKFKRKTNIDIPNSMLELLIKEKGIEIVEKYIDNWDKFKYKDINNVIGFFVSAVLEEYDIPVESKKENSYKNYEQRKYEDKELESLYDNL